MGLFDSFAPLAPIVGAAVGSIGGPVGAMAGATAGGAISGYLGSQSAAQTEANAANNASATQLSMFDTQNANQAPYRQAGVDALGQIQTNLPAWNAAPNQQQILANDPGYQFRLAQGNEAIQNSAAASSGLVNAGTLAALGNYSQNQASSEYGAAFDRYQSQITNSYNRLAGVANLGEGAATNTGANAMQTATNIGNNAIGAGNSIAAGQIAGTNAITGAIGQGIGLYNTNQLLSKFGPQTPQMPGGSPVAPMPYGGPGGLSGYNGYQEELPASNSVADLATA